MYRQTSEARRGATIPTQLTTGLVQTSTILP